MQLYYVDIDCYRTEPVSLEFGQFETFYRSSDVVAALAEKDSTHARESAVKAESAKRILDMLDATRKQLAAAETELRQVRSAAIHGMNAAHEGARVELATARKLHAESQPHLIESERGANALLTDENEQLTISLAQRDAELVRLREALSFYANAHNWCPVDNGDDDMAAVLLTGGEEHEHGWARAHTALNPPAAAAAGEK